MRVPRDLTTDPSPTPAPTGALVAARSGRGRHHPVGVAALAGRHLHRQPLVRLGQLPRRLLHAAGDQARALRRLRRHLLRRPVDQPRGVRPHRRPRRRPGPGRRAGAALPAIRAPLRRAHLRGAGLHPRPDRRLGDDRAVEQLDPLPPRREFRRAPTRSSTRTSASTSSSCPSSPSWWTGRWPSSS